MSVLPGGGVLEYEVLSPSVEGDQLVGAGDVSVPLADILRLEVRAFRMGCTIKWAGALALVPVAVVWVQFAINNR